MAIHFTGDNHALWYQQNTKVDTEQLFSEGRGEFLQASGPGLSSVTNTSLLYVSPTDTSHWACKQQRANSYLNQGYSALHIVTS